MLEHTQKHMLQTVDRFRPLLVMMAIDCKHYNMFNKNMNYSYRPEEWEWLQSKGAPLRMLAYKIAKRQHSKGRFFLIENPQRSELWETQEIRELLEMSGVWKVTCDTGAFGMQINGKDVCKPMTFVGNMPGLDEVLSRRLTQQQRSQCTPIQGDMTRKSQAYPEELCRTILKALLDHVRLLQPQRFCHRQPGIHHALPVQQPSEDLAAWDPIYDHVDKAFQRSSKKPFLIDISSSFGKAIQDLVRIDAIKIQAVANPTTRRVPPNIDEWYTRANVLFFNDGQRAVEVEDLGDLRFPKQRFSKPVRYGIFIYGDRRKIPEAEPQPQRQEQPGPSVVPGLSTDIDFPGLPSTVPPEVKRTAARLHLNMGHPSSQELCRLLAYEGTIPDALYQAVRALRCATCERLRPPQKARPSTTPNITVGQFNDELQSDICYCKTVDGTTFMILGAVDRATGFHQAGILGDRSGEEVFQLMHRMWFQPYGLPLRIVCDPDPSFKGMFQHKIQAIGILLEHCPAEAHHVIGMVERRNSILRLTLEKLIDQFAANTVEQCHVLVTSACHAMNAAIHTHGRSAYQMVFGRQPRMLDSNFSDSMVLATSSTAIKSADETNLGFKAELVRNEAIKTVHNLDVSQHLRRALLRKTRITKIADLQAGQRCAFWRWSRKGGPRKRGTWVIGRFLSWDPSYPGKQAWIRSGNTTVLVTAEQLRAAFGYEDWTPSQEDVAALKDAAKSFSDHLFDDRGPAPPEQTLEDDEVQAFPDAAPPTPSMMVPATPVAQPSTPALPVPRPRTQSPRPNTPDAARTTNIQVHVDQPTQVTNQTLQYQRFGDMLSTMSRRARSRTPTSRRRPTDLRISPAAQPAAQLEVDKSVPPQLDAPQSEVEPLPQTPPAVSPPLMPPPPSANTILDAEDEPDANEPPETPFPLDDFPGLKDPPGDEQPDGYEPTSPVSSEEPPVPQPAVVDLTEPSQQSDTAMTTGGPQAASSSSLPQLPQKRNFEAMISLIPAGEHQFHRPHADWDGSPPIGYGPRLNRFHQAYLSTAERKEDVADIQKPADESDTTNDSDTDESDDESNATATTKSAHLQPVRQQGTNAKTHQSQPVPAYKQGMTRQEVKALDRELPWRSILSMPAKYVDKFLEAISKEALAWQQWQSVQPLSDAEAEQVFRDPKLSRRILPSRACYRDKSCGIGEIRPKCRIVALGHLDPDLSQLSRNAATPGRTAEHVMFLMIVAGYNGCLFDTSFSWVGYIGDAKTAFLQGMQDPKERAGPLFLRPPRDGLIAQTNTWTAKLYQIHGNIYGLANAPVTWQKEVIKRLHSISFQQHGFDRQLFVKRNEQGQIVAAILTYVDDFVILHREDYDIKEVFALFEWGSLEKMELDKPVTFKGKELTLCRDNQSKKVDMKITMKKFIDGLDSGKVQRGRPPDAKLTPDEQKELRSVCGCLQ